MNLQECYSVLGVSEGASLSEIVQAYKDLVIVWHPDRFNHNPDLQKKAEEKLKKINEAYAKLKEHLGDNPNSSSATPEQNQFYYVDSECRYLGGDPRHRELSKTEKRDLEAAIEITSSGVTILMQRAGSQPDVVFYPAATIVSLVKFVDRNRIVCFRAKDPEELLKDNFRVDLEFRNDYHAQLFEKRMKEAFGPLEPPKPKPKTKSSTDSPQDSEVNEFAVEACILLLIILIPLFITLVFDLVFE